MIRSRFRRRRRTRRRRPPEPARPLAAEIEQPVIGRAPAVSSDADRGARSRSRTPRSILQPIRCYAPPMAAQARTDLPMPRCGCLPLAGVRRDAVSVRGERSRTRRRAAAAARRGGAGRSRCCTWRTSQRHFDADRRTVTFPVGGDARRATRLPGRPDRRQAASGTVPAMRPRCVSTVRVRTPSGTGRRRSSSTAGRRWISATPCCQPPLSVFMAMALSVPLCLGMS